ncbi:hypothetical protein, partial [Enterococcus faecium]|uniref:hypothetical protein n=1 Tax=Enterococcus faecium TaxID=1352 RepID=UPI00265AD6ED
MKKRGGRAEAKRHNGPEKRRERQGRTAGNTDARATEEAREADKATVAGKANGKREYACARNARRIDES